MNTPEIITIVISIILAIFAALLTSHFRLGKIFGIIGEIRIQREETSKRMDRLEDRVEKYLEYLVLGAKSKKEKIPDQIKEKLNELGEILEKVVPEGNPISASELKKLNHYRNLIVHGQSINQKQREEIKLLLQKVESELSTEEEREKLGNIGAAILGFIGGLVIGSFLGGKGEE